MLDDELDGRLLNWGRCYRDKDTKLGYPTRVPFMQFASKSELMAELDAAHIENIISSLYMGGLGRSELYAFILKVEYIKKPDSHVSGRASEVRKEFHCPCAERTYYYHLAKAKQVIELFAEPIK